MSDFKLSNYEIEKLYNHSVDNGNMEKGRFFQVLFNDDNNGFDIKLSSQIYMRIVFYPSKNDIETLQIIKVKNGNNEEKISFSKFNFQQLELFLQFLKDIDLNSISDKKLKLADNSLDILDENTKKQIATLLSGEQGAETIQSLLDDGHITSDDIINTGYRKAQLNIFRKLLNEENFLQQYKTLSKNVMN
jgi:hypothetical protein